MQKNKTPLRHLCRNEKFNIQDRSKIHTLRGTSLCNTVQYPAAVRACVLREEGGDRRAFVQVDIMRVEIAFPCNTGRGKRRNKEGHEEDGRFFLSSCNNLSSTQRETMISMKGYDKRRWFVINFLGNFSKCRFFIVFVPFVL